MPSCCAFGCTNRPLQHPGITFHKIPKDEPRRSKWILAIRRKDWHPTKNSHLCSCHFTKDCFDRSMKNVLLTKNAVPTIFKGFPAHLQKKLFVRETFNSIVKEEYEQESDLDPNISNSSGSTPVSPAKEDYKRALEASAEKDDKNRKKIKLLQRAKALQTYLLILNTES